MKLHQVVNMSNVSFSIAGAMNHRFFCPGLFRAIVDCDPFERKESFGLPTKIYPTLRIEIPDSITPHVWVEVARYKIESADPISFEVVGNIQISIGWDGLPMKSWKHGEKWNYRRIQVVIPVPDHLDESAASRMNDN